MKEGMLLTWFLLMNLWLHDEVAIDWLIDCRTMTDHYPQEGPMHPCSQDGRTYRRQTNGNAQGYCM